jgi:hypothetical protein
MKNKKNKSTEDFEEELKSRLDQAIAASLLYDRTELSGKRAKALEYYQGKMKDVPNVEGRSSVVSKDVATVINWMLPGIIRTFTQSGRIVDYEPVGPEDEDYADQASDFINHKFMKENDGYRLLYAAVHDALLMGDGILKVHYDSTPEHETHNFSQLGEEELAFLMMDDSNEITSQDTYTEEVNGVELELYDVQVKRIKKRKGLSFEAVEPENFIMDKECDTIDESRFVAQRYFETKSSLVEAGFNKDQIDNIPSDGVFSYSEEELAREEEAFSYDLNRNDIIDESTRIVEVYECYVKIDVDDDGIAETVKATYAGRSGASELLDWEVWEDDYPYVAVPCEPIPHRFDSQSIADQTMDLQRIKTVLNRQLLDNVYSHNNPQPEVEEGSVINKDSIANPKPGQPIIKKRGSLPVQWNNIPFIADKALMAIGNVDQEIERRTGISKASMALDPDALQNQTATAVNATQDANRSKVELVARNMAELGFRTLFRKALRLVVKNQDRSETIRLRGKWVKMDPSAWNADMDCCVNTGLGTGSRERDVVALNGVMGLQFNFMERFAQQGMHDEALEMVPKVIKTATKIAEVTGLKNADDYYPTITPEKLQKMSQMVQQQKSQPSEDEKKLQSEMQMEQQKMTMESQFKQQEHAAKVELEKIKIEQQALREQEQARADVMVHQHEADLKAAYQDKELQAKREKEAKDYEIAMAQLALKEREIEIKIRDMGHSHSVDLAEKQLDIDKHEDTMDYQYEQLNQQKEISRANAKASEKRAPSE